MDEHLFKGLMSKKDEKYAHILLKCATFALGFTQIM